MSNEFSFAKEVMGGIMSVLIPSSQNHYLPLFFEIPLILITLNYFNGKSLEKQEKRISELWEKERVKQRRKNRRNR